MRMPSQSGCKQELCLRKLVFQLKFNCSFGKLNHRAAGNIIVSATSVHTSTQACLRKQLARSDRYDLPRLAPGGTGAEIVLQEGFGSALDRNGCVSRPPLRTRLLPRLQCIITLKL